MTELADRGVLAGVLTGSDYEELSDGLLVAVTESNPPAELDLYVEEMGRAFGGGA